MVGLWAYCVGLWGRLRRATWMSMFKHNARILHMTMRLSYGFTGEYYLENAIWIREEYEETHQYMTEAQRLGAYLDKVYSSYDSALWDAEMLAPKLLYRRKDRRYDECLRHGEPFEAMWHPYQCGYVHEITGEYVRTTTTPEYDSYPFWVKVSNPSSHLDDRSRKLMAAKAGLLVALEILHNLNQTST